MDPVNNDLESLGDDCLRLSLVHLAFIQPIKYAIIDLLGVGMVSLRFNKLSNQIFRYFFFEWKETSDTGTLASFLCF